MRHWFPLAAALLCAAVAPDPHQCCPIPHDFPAAWAKNCPSLCAESSVPLAADRCVVFRAPMKTASSMASVVGHKIMKELGPVLGYTVADESGEGMEGWGFRAMISPKNRSMTVTDGMGEKDYKHADHWPRHVIAIARDPRDSVISYYHHTRLEFFRKGLPKMPVVPYRGWLDVQEFKGHGIGCSPRLFFRKNIDLMSRFLAPDTQEGMLLIKFDWLTRHLRASIRQMAAFLFPSHKRKLASEEAGEVMDSIAARYDSLRSNKTSDGGGVTRFREGRSGGFRTVFDAAELASLNGIMCQKTPLMAALWGQCCRKK